jgi:hypothetical protein
MPLKFERHRGCKLRFVGERESAGEKLLERSFSPDPFSRTFRKDIDK